MTWKIEMYTRFVEDSPKILFVDDDKSVLKALGRFARSRKWRADFSESGKNALEMAESKTYDLVVSDMRMPRMSGAQFLREMKSSHPDTVRILLSGYADMRLVEDVANQSEAYGLLSKPWDEFVLAETIVNGFIFGLNQKQDIDSSRQRVRQIINEYSKGYYIEDAELRRACEEFKESLVGYKCNRRELD